MLKALMVNDFSFQSIEEMNDNLLYIDYNFKKFGFEDLIIDPSLANKHNGNLYNLLHELNIPKNLYFFTLYANGYTNPTDYQRDHLVLKLPVRPPIPSS